MSDFKGRRFPVSIILVCVRWYCKYGISERSNQYVCYLLLEHPS